MRQKHKEINRLFENFVEKVRILKEKQKNLQEEAKIKDFG
jgi:hypothetical protein